MGIRKDVLAGIAVAVLGLLVGAVVVWVLPGSSAPVLSASSAADGHGPERAGDDVEGSWRPEGDAPGAWLQTAWEDPTTVDRISLRLEDDPGSEPVTGFIAFSDGSRLAVRLSTPVTDMAIAPRMVSWARFTFAGAPSADVGVDAFLAEGGVGPAGPVDLETAEGGDAAPLAELTGAGPELVDGDSGTAGDIVSTVRLDWERPRELSRLSLAGAPGSSRLTSATVTFSDGSSLPIGAVLADVTRPTELAFMPRSTTSVRLTVTSSEGDGEVSLSELSAFGPGADPAGPSGLGDEPVEPSGAAEGCAAPGERPDDFTGVVVLCPTNGAQVGRQVDLTVAVGPSYDAVRAEVWQYDGPEATGRPDAGRRAAAVDDSGVAVLDVRLESPARGPLVVVVTAQGDGVEDREARLQLVRPGPPAADEAPAPAGRSLVYADEFDGPLSISRTGEGSDYVLGKPEYWGVTDFGSAIFADPDRGLDNVVIRDGYLDLSVQPRPDDLEDPNGWGREHVGGMLASARPGGSGFAAQYGYFEARMMAPAEPGTWGAFWTLTTPNLLAGDEGVPYAEREDAEIDVVELYGHDPTGACHTTHQYPQEGLGEALCGQRWGSQQTALGWHTYGADVRPDRIDYYVDGEKVGTTAQVPDGGDTMFFMLDLALGGGWPIELAPVRDRASLYVDWVRVYV